MKSKRVPLTANNLTTHIISEIKQSGNLAVRVNTIGIYDEILGIRRKSTTQRGTSDIIASIRGMFHAIEIKIGRDRMSYEQKEFKKEVINSGGIYVVIKNPSDWNAFKLKFLK